MDKGRREFLTVAAASTAAMATNAFGADKFARDQMTTTMPAPP